MSKTFLERVSEAADGTGIHVSNASVGALVPGTSLDVRLSIDDGAVFFQASQFLTGDMYQIHLGKTSEGELMTVQSILESHHLSCKQYGCHQTHSQCVLLPEREEPFHVSVEVKTAKDPELVLLVCRGVVTAHVVPPETTKQIGQGISGYQYSILVKPDEPYIVGGRNLGQTLLALIRVPIEMTGDDYTSDCEVEMVMPHKVKDPASRGLGPCIGEWDRITELPERDPRGNISVSLWHIVTARDDEDIHAMVGI